MREAPVAKAIQAELQSISDQNGGVLLPAAVVEFAKNPDTQLHGQFEWDDSEAARQYRLEQARRIIRVSVVVVGERSENVRAFVSLKKDRYDGGGYRPMTVVLSSEELHAQMLSDALSELQAIKAKHRRLQELRPVFDAIDTVASVVEASPGDEPPSAFAHLLSGAGRSEASITRHKGTRY